MTDLDRRQFVRLNAAALAGAALPSTVVAGTGPGPGSHAPSAARIDSPGFYRFSVGEHRITVLSDGHFNFPMEWLEDDLEPTEFLAANAQPEERMEYFHSRLIPTDRVPLQVSPLLVEAAGRRVLVDAGWGGGEVAPSTGRLGPSFDAVGVAPESVDTVILTHAHPDHLGGLLDPATGQPAFPGAEVVLSEDEHRFWTDDATAALLEPVIADGAGLQAAMRGTLDAVGDRLRTVREGEELAPGIRGLPSPGHTPGHISLVVDVGHKQLLLTGDAITNTHTSFEHPEWQIVVDADPEQAGRTRRRLLDRAAADEMLILGYHLPFPGLGYALRDGDAYRWHPAGWRVLT
jgi:glyoxylase-like metal-dependent hydrolase (beta-lactamase superfamily II)